MLSIPEKLFGAKNYQVSYERKKVWNIDFRLVFRGATNIKKEIS